MPDRKIEVVRRGRPGADGLSNLVDVIDTAVDYTLLSTDSGKALHCSAALTATLPAATAAGWSIIIDADGGDVTISSAQPINGSASINLVNGNTAYIYSDGSNMYARFYVATALGSITASAVNSTPASLIPGTNVQAAIDQINALIQTNIDAIASVFVPGFLAHFSMSSVPTGWLRCDGSAVSRTTYDNLFANLGEIHGAGDGSTTFNIPDYRGYFLRDLDDGAGVDIGRVFASTQADEIRSHRHAFPTVSDTGSGGQSEALRKSNASSGTLANKNTEYTGGTETRPVNKSVIICVRY